MKKILLTLAFIALPLGAHASLLLEPYAAYNYTSIDDTANTENGSGAALGGRIGYSTLGLQAGLDLLSSTSHLGGAYDNNMTGMQYTAFVGFKFPILLRAYAGYTFMANADTKVDATGDKVKFSDGKGYLLGASFTGLPFIDINFEYRKGTYDKTKIGGVDQGHKADYSTYLVSVSLPLEF